MSTHSPDFNPPGDTGPPLINPAVGLTANFISVLELFRAQRDSQVNPQAPPPSPSLAVQLLPDNDTMALGDILSSQITFVSNGEFEQLRQVIPSQPTGLPPLALLEAARIAIPFLSGDLVISSLGILENIAAHNDASTLPVSAVPPEVWAALRSAIPSQGSRLSSIVASSPAFSTARVSVSGNSSPMDDSPTNTPFPPLFLEASSLIEPPPLNNEDNPIWVSSGDETPHDNGQVFNDRMSSFSVDHTPGPHNPSPAHTISHHADSRMSSTRAMINSDTMFNNADNAVKRTLEELNEGVEGYSHYFLSEQLTICDEPAIEIASPHLRRILDIAGATLSMGPRSEHDGDIWRMLRPSDWYRASTFILASVLRGCVRTPRVAKLGNFPLLPLRDSFIYSNNLPELETQVDALRAMATQILENLQVDNGPLMPQDSVDGIRSTVWRSHEAHIRAIVEQEALKVAHRLSTMGLSDLIDKLERDAPMEEITQVLKDDIAEQVCSKYNNAILVIKSNAYKQAVAEAEQKGREQAAKETVPYEARLLETAKEQARLKANSEFTRLLADERSKIAPKVDAEIADEHARFISDRRKTLVAQLDSLSLDAEKEFVLAAATRLGLALGSTDQPSKKAKLDTRKPRPAPITPRGRSSSIVSSTSQSKKRAYSPSAVVITTPIPPKPKDGDTTPKQIHTVNFTLKQETVPPFTTPSTPSVIREAVDLAQSVSLRGSASSIHNSANAMAMDPETIDYRNIFPPGIPAPPSNPSLPPQMSRTPEFGIDQEVNDGVAMTSSPSVAPTTDTALIIQEINRSIAHGMKEIWATVRRLEAEVRGGPIRIPPRAGPGYREEHHRIPQAQQAHSVAPVPALTNQENTSQTVAQDATPFLPNDTPRPAHEEFPRVDDEEFPSLENAQNSSNNRRRRAQSAKIRLRQQVPGATGPDDGHIPIQSAQSRIKPLFANIATQATVAQNQKIANTAHQARAVQGRKPGGNQGPTRRNAADAELTEVAVIRFGGLEDAEEERKFRARNPVEIVQAVQRELSKRAKNPPAVLSGRWSVSSNATGNFVFTLAGIISPRDIMALKPHLCSPFKGHTELVPTKGWTWLQLRQVPTEDLDGCVWGSEDLLSAFTANPCFKNALICVQPHWQGNPLNNDKLFSTVLAAIIDEDNSICQSALSHGVRMFGAQVKFLRCGDNPTLQQCSRCHMLGHYSSSPRCKLPKNAIKCYHCGKAHDGRNHDYECNAKHKVLGKCDCSLKCLLCKKTDHHARSRSCLKRGDFAPPRLPDQNSEEPFQIVGKKRSTKGKERMEPYSPRSSIFIVPEVKHIPLAKCPKEEGKNILLCMCCPLPSVAEYKRRFVSPHETCKDPSAIPTARIISSKGTSVLNMYTVLQKRKAYGTALLTSNINDDNTNISALEDEEEIALMLQEAKQEVLDEENIEQAMRGQSGEWSDAIEDGFLPPLDPKDKDMGWGPSASMILDA
jgi:hypothetical protein